VRDRGSKEKGGGRNAAPFCSSISGDASRMRIFGEEIPFEDMFDKPVRV
jgi:hypothetical protein